MALSDKKLRTIFDNVPRKVFFTLQSEFGDDKTMRKVYAHISDGYEITIEPVEERIDDKQVIASKDEDRLQIA